MAKENALGFTRADYKGGPTTLCPGCGHNSIMNQIISMAHEMNLNHHEIIKLSGIGCSSKSPAYFLGQSHGFNSLHGRMPSIATGPVASHPMAMWAMSPWWPIQSIICPPPKPIHQRQFQS